MRGIFWDFLGFSFFLSFLPGFGPSEDLLFFHRGILYGGFFGVDSLKKILSLLDQDSSNICMHGCNNPKDLMDSWQGFDDPF